MEDYTIIFIGKSGCGKGTQIQKINDFFKTIGYETIEHLEVGQNLREFINSNSYTSKLAQVSNAQGKLQPAFLAIWAWVNKMIETYTGQKIIIVDGAPRQLGEAKIIHEMFDFYSRKNRFIIHIDVSDEWATQKLLLRERADDNPDGIAQRLNWFNTNSPGILSFFRNEDDYTVVHINGEQDINAVHQDIIKAIGL
jgi:adenylate kinase family enzyme